MCNGFFFRDRLSAFRSTFVCRKPLASPPHAIYQMLSPIRSSTLLYIPSASPFFTPAHILSANHLSSVLRFDAHVFIGEGSFIIIGNASTSARRMSMDASLSGGSDSLRRSSGIEPDEGSESLQEKVVIPMASRLDPLYLAWWSTKRTKISSR